MCRHFVMSLCVICSVCVYWRTTGGFTLKVVMFIYIYLYVLTAM